MPWGNHGVFLEHPSQGGLCRAPNQKPLSESTGNSLREVQKIWGMWTHSTFHLLLRAGPFLSWDSLLSGDFLDLSRGSGEALSGVLSKRNPKEKTKVCGGRVFQTSSCQVIFSFGGNHAPNQHFLMVTRSLSQFLGPRVSHIAQRQRT